MTTSQLYSEVLSDLTAARSKMLSPEWQAALDQSTPDVRVQAGNQMMHLQSAILALSNATLGDIAAAMQSNANALSTSISDLTNALKNITQVQSILGNVAKVLSVVGKVVPLL